MLKTSEYFLTYNNVRSVNLIQIDNDRFELPFISPCPGMLTLYNRKGKLVDFEFKDQVRTNQTCGPIDSKYYTLLIQQDDMYVYMYRLQLVVTSVSSY